MNWPLFLYILVALLCLYALYLFRFKTFDACNNERVITHNIVYLTVLIVSFIPIGNVITLIVLTAAALIGIEAEYIYIDSWLFKKPKQN